LAVGASGEASATTEAPTAWSNRRVRRVRYFPELDWQPGCPQVQRASAWSPAFLQWSLQ